MDWCRKENDRRRFYNSVLRKRKSSCQWCCPLLSAEGRKNPLWNGWLYITNRIIRARFHSKYCKLTILQCYAPTNETWDEVKDNWYEQLQYEVSMAVNSNKQCRKVYDVNLLKSQNVRRSFSIELKIRFAALAELEDETDPDPV